MNRNRSEYRANLSLHEATLVAQGDAEAASVRQWLAIYRHERLMQKQAQRIAQARFACVAIIAGILPVLFIIATN